MRTRISQRRPYVNWVMCCERLYSVYNVLYLRRKYGVGARIILSKMDVEDAFRQVVVEWERSPMFGYVFRDLVVVNMRLQFGWRNSPGF